MNVEARDRLSQVDGVISFLCFLMLGDVNKLVSNNSICSLCEGWTELQKFRLNSGRLLFVFTALFETVTNAVIITRP